MELFIIYVALCIVVCVLARSKGRSGLGWFFLSLLISPLIALIIVAILGETDEKRRQKLQSYIETTEEIKKNMSATTADTQKSISIKDDAMAELKRTKELLNLGVITQEEYDTKKAELMPLLMTTSSSDETTENPSLTQLSVGTEEQDKEDSGGWIWVIINSIIFILLLLVLVIAR